MAQFLFNAFALFTLICAAGVVLCRNAVNGALCLLLALVGVAGLFVGLNAYLLAFMLLLVYAGAIVALFLFIIMLLDVKGDQRPGLRHLPIVARLIALALVGAGVLSFFARGRLVAPLPGAVPAVGVELKHYAYQLFTTYLLPVQLLGYLLLAAMLGVSVLSRKPDSAEDTK